MMVTKTQAGVAVLINLGMLYFVGRIDEPKTKEITPITRPAPGSVYSMADRIKMPNDCNKLLDFRKNSNTMRYEVQCIDDREQRAFYTSTNLTTDYAWIKTIAEMPRKE